MNQSLLQRKFQAVEDTAPLCLWPNSSQEEIETVIRAVYRQVLGNIHVMESDRLTVPESKLKNGEISVREFIRQAAKSRLYRANFFENCPRYRAIELNFKHLLGRAPSDYTEMSAHSQILDTLGYEAEIDSYLDSDEYQDAFGEDIVPYYRGYKTQTGAKQLEFNHMLKLAASASGSDKESSSENRSILQTSLFENSLSTQRFFTPARGDTVERSAWERQYQAFRDRDLVELVPGYSAEEAEVVIRAVYRQVLGNAHIMASERLTVPESQLKRGELSVRGFVRAVAKSEFYRSRFFESCYRYRAIELNFKHLLGRAPEDFTEMKRHSQILDTQGYEADIDSYLDSDEYQDAFGENIVPCHRGYKTQTGKSMIGFTRMLELLRSASSSDKEVSKPQLQQAIIGNYPSGERQGPTDTAQLLKSILAPKPQGAIAANLLQTAAQLEAYEALQSQCAEQEEVLQRLRQQLADLKPFGAIGMSIIGQWSSDLGSDSDTSLTAIAEETGSDEDLQKRSDAMAAEIKALEAKIADERRLASIGEARVNRWRGRIFTR